MRTQEWIAGAVVILDKELVNGVAQWAFVARKRMVGMTLLMVATEALVARLSMNVHLNQAANLIISGLSKKYSR